VLARKLQEEVVVVTRRLLGEEHPATLTARLNLAATLSAQGDSAGARPQQEQQASALVSSLHQGGLLAL
jgi:Tetratricopeptide repeat